MVLRNHPAISCQLFGQLFPQHIFVASTSRFGLEEINEFVLQDLSADSRDPADVVRWPGAGRLWPVPSSRRPHWLQEVHDLVLWFILVHLSAPCQSPILHTVGRPFYIYIFDHLYAIFPRPHTTAPLWLFVVLSPCHFLFMCFFNVMMK
jgi:hypothetical protein